MIDIKQCMKIFNNYFKNFDIKNKNILSKFHHTYRVMDFANEIASSLNLSKQEVLIAQLCGLLHDIARFKQVAEYNTFIDHDSFDHGDMSYEILKENDFIKQFTDNEEIINIVLKAVKNHNKKQVESNLSEKELLFANITRDADKLDIMREQCNMITDHKLVLKDIILKDIYNYELTKNIDSITNVDCILRCIAFIFDLNFKYSFDFLKENKIIDKKIKLLQANIYDKRLDELEIFVNKYIERRLI
ncbi:MAG: HD domain-containing protein [Bacilli bacterium]|nr:HD domain-containing protein [Bacilli bacterium]